MDFLLETETFFRKEGFDLHLEKSSDEFPFGCLLVNLGEDKQERERMLVITSEEQVLDDSKEARFIRVQLQFSLPFQFQLDARGELYSLLFFLNRSLDLPGFEVDELNDRVVFSYVWFGKNEPMDEMLLWGIFGQILMIADGYSDVIEDVATGKKTFVNVLEEIHELLPQA